MRTPVSLLLLFLIAAVVLRAEATTFLVPDAEVDRRFELRIDHRVVPLVHAAGGYGFANFVVNGPVEVELTAPDDTYWGSGVEVQPWRWGIRPERHGRTVRFTLEHPGKLCISRPNRFGFSDDLIFLFAQAPADVAPVPHGDQVRYYGPGIHREHIHARSGDTIYLDAGAVVYGSITVWDAENVKVLGLGTIIYDGPQNPNDDEGWKHQPDWHAITLHNARHVEINGPTCIVRSRTWMIQLQDCHDVLFNNVKVIGRFRQNANQDGIDWLGGGDTVVRNCFFRCSDDVFALYGNTGFYSAEARVPGHEVRNITIEGCVLSTSVSNIVRVSFAQKRFDSADFTMRDCDVIHMGIGGCVVPFALFEVWGDDASAGTHANYRFENIRLEDWYSLAQLRYPHGRVRNVVFKDIWAFDQPSLAPSRIEGDVAGVSCENVVIGGRGVAVAEDIPLDPARGAVKADIVPDVTPGRIEVTPACVRVGVPTTFTASPAASPGFKYDWSFGDGTHAMGREVKHAFVDAEGTRRDGSGRFRVLLRITSPDGRVDWRSTSVVVVTSLQPPAEPQAIEPGLRYRYFEGQWSAVPELASLHPTAEGIADVADATPRKRAQNYALAYDGFIKAPADGGYVFTLLSNDGGELEIDGQRIVTSPQPLPQPCQTVGNAVQARAGTVAIKAGWHRITLAETHTDGPDGFAVRWEGPGFQQQPIPARALGHEASAR